jgi:hypothetical protein
MLHGIFLGRLVCNKDVIYWFYFDLVVSSLNDNRNYRGFTLQAVDNAACSAAKL